MSEILKNQNVPQNLKKYNNNSGSKAVDTYREVPETKPGSLASKANMVAEFDKKNKTKKK